MKPIYIALLASALIFSGIAAEGPTSHSPGRLAQIDLELTLEQYKQSRMRQRHRLEEWVQTLRRIAEELRAKAMHLERDLSDASGEKAKEVSETGHGAAGTAEGDLRKRMLGTWQLVSFADGRISDANVGELKFIGDRHWSVSRLNPRTGKLDYHMGGSYTLDGNEYVETVEYGTGGPVGETFTYKLMVDGDKFTQSGDGNPWSLLFKRAK